MKKIFKRRHKNSKSYILIVFFVLIGITAGYAVINTTLSITGAGKLSQNSWNVHFENLVILDDNATHVPTAPSIDSGKTNVEFAVVLGKPGSSYEFTVDVVNSGTIDAMISSISNSALTTEQQKYIDYSVTYYDGGTIATKDILKAGTTETIRIRVRFLSDITASNLPATSDTLRLSYSINYQQADSTAKTRTEKIICKRATSIHSETCQHTSGDYCYGAGYSASGSKKTTTVKYGNLGTSGVLETGNIFDCDVTGDGNYDQRFYYLRDIDSKTSALIYYTVAFYNPIDTTKAPMVTYDNRYTGSSITSKYGPVVAKLVLPRTDDWPNVRLTNSNVNITDASGNVVVNNFKYSGYAARLLSYSDLELSYCTPNSGLINSCLFLHENTKFTNPNSPIENIWLENPYASNNPSAYLIQSSHKRLISSAATTYAGVKPVIEVAKTAISY